MFECTQCGKPAMYDANGHMLCLTCYQKVFQMNQIQIANLERMAEGALDDMAAIAGFDIRPPKKQPVVQFLQAGKVMLNNIHVNNSTVGSINTGKIQNLDIAIGMASSENTEIAKALTKLAEATIKSNELQITQKEEILELLNSLADEAVLPKERQRSGVIKSVCTTLSGLLSTSANLATIWESCKEVIKSAFN